MSEYLNFEGLQQYHNSVKAALDTKVNKGDLLSYSEEVVMERDINNIETITKTEIIEYSEKEHIDYDGSELTKEITITRPCKLYLGFECKNSEQEPGRITQTPASVNYQIHVGDDVYNSITPMVTKNSGDFEYVLLDITADMLPYTTFIKFCAKALSNYSLKEIGQTIHLYSDIYYKVDSEIKSELLKGYVKEEDILTEGEGSVKKIKDELLPEVDLTDYEKTTNKVTSITASSTDTQYPSAKSVTKYVGTSIANIPIADKTKNGLMSSTLFNTLKSANSKGDSALMQLNNKASTSLDNITTEGEAKIKEIASTVIPTDTNWYGTQAEFDAITEYQEGVNYYIYD